MTAGAAATLHPFDETRAPELMRWFTDRESTRVWRGPEFRYPFTPETCRADARLAELRTRMLVADDGGLAAFGRYYLRAGRRSAPVPARCSSCRPTRARKPRMNDWVFRPCPVPNRRPSSIPASTW